MHYLVANKPPANYVEINQPDTFSNKKIYIFGYIDNSDDPKQFDLQEYSSPGETTAMTFGDGLHDVNNMYIAQPAVEGGYSGAPVFYKDAISNALVFAGTESSHVGDLYTIIIPPAEVKKEIARALLRTGH